MGGTLPLVVRLPNGSIRKATIDTYMIKEELLRPDVLQNADGAIDAMFARVEKARQDYADLIKSWGSKNADEIAYGMKPQLAPDYYGLVVFDLQTGSLFEMQDYTAYTKPHDFAVSHPNVKKEEDLETALLKEHIALGWAPTITISVTDTLVAKAIEANILPEGSDGESYAFPAARRDELLAFVEAHVAKPFSPPSVEKLAPRDKHIALEKAAKEWIKKNEGLCSTPICDARIDTNFGGINVQKFDNTRAGVLSFKEKLQEIGFEFTEEELEIWREWRADEAELEMDAQEECSSPAP